MNVSEMTGREFRTFYEFNIPGNGEVSLKAIITVPTILFQTQLQVQQGRLRHEIYAPIGLSETVSFSVPTPQPTPIYPLAILATGAKGLSGYIRQNSIFSGGTFTGGVLADVNLVDSGDPGGNGRAMTAALDAVTIPRGFNPGNYYIRLRNMLSSPLVGVYKLTWLEIPIISTP